MVFLPMPKLLMNITNQPAREVIRTKMTGVHQKGRRIAWDRAGWPLRQAAWLGRQHDGDATCLDRESVFVDIQRPATHDRLVESPGPPRVALSSKLNPIDLRALQRYAGFQPDGGEHEAHHRLLSSVGVDVSVGADGCERHRGVRADSPALAAAELVQCLLRGEQVDDRLRLRARLETERPRG